MSLLTIPHFEIGLLVHYEENPSELLEIQCNGLLFWKISIFDDETLICRCTRTSSPSSASRCHP